MDRSELQGAYDKAGSVMALSRRLGVTRYHARRMLSSAGIPVRTVGWRSPTSGGWHGKAGPDHPRWKGPDDLPPDLQRLYDDAGSVRALARRLGVMVVTARAWLRRLGIPIRRRGFRAPRRGTAPPQDR